MPARFQRFAFIFFSVYVMFVGGGPYYYTVFPVRVLHHVVMTVVLALWLVRHLKDGLPLTPLNVGLYAAVCVWIASAVVSADPRMAAENLWFPVVHLLIFFVLADLFQRGRQRLVMETLFILAALVVSMALMQFASWLFGLGFVPGTSVGWLGVLNAQLPIPPVTPNLYLPLGVSTWLAAYVAPNVMLAFGWSLTARQRDFRFVLRLLTGALLLVLILTFSRGGFIALGVGIVLFIVLRVSQSAAVRQLNLQRAAAVFVPVILIAGIVGLTVLTIGQSAGRYGGDYLRLNLWQSAVGIARDNPVLGIGPGLFGRGVRLYRDPVHVDDRLGTAHNILLNTAAEEGFVGLLVLGLLAALLFRAWWRLWRAAPVTETAAGTTLLQNFFSRGDGRKLRLEVAFAALVGIAVQSMFDTFTTTPLVVMIALLAVYCTVEPGTLRSKPRGSRWAAGVALVIVLGYGVFWIQSDRAQAAFIRSARTGDLAAAREAATIDPALNLYPLQIAYLTAQQPPDDDPSVAVAAYQAILALEPSWDTGWINLAGLQDRAGDVEGAFASLDRAAGINANNLAAFNRARLAEAHQTLPDDEIVQQYVDAMPQTGLPLSTWWMQTDIRRRAVEQYYNELSESPDLQYWIASAQFPERRADLVVSDPVTAADWWIRGQYALEVEGDPVAAQDAFTQAIALNPRVGDYYAARAQAALASGALPAERDLKMAQLLGSGYDPISLIQAQMATGAAHERLLIAAGPARIIEQNFEGVLFGGRTGSFELSPVMRGPGPGTRVLQPWYELAALYEAEGRTSEARGVYIAILDVAPYEPLAAERLSALGEG